MALTMTTRNVGRRTAAPRGGRTCGQTGRGGGRTGDQGGRGGGRGDHISNQGINGSRNDNATDDNIQEDDRNANLGNSRNGCSYKEFMACKPKEFHGKGGAVAYIHWVEKMEAVQDISSCGDNQKVKYSTSSLTGRALTWWNSEVRTRGREAVRLEIEFWSYSIVGAGHAAYTNRFYELARLVHHLVTPETKRIERYIYGLAPQIHRIVAATKPAMIQNAILKVVVLTDEAVRNGSLITLKLYMFMVRVVEENMKN
ncbi:hypothetical protein Tco_0916836 [Tanacetum coccineum]